MRCEDARRGLLGDARDAEAGRHLEACPACFDALEAADPVAGALRAARPARASALRLLAVAAALAVIAVELLGIEPARLSGVGAVVPVLAEAATGAVDILLAVRSALPDVPGLLTVLTAITLAACALWLRLTLRVAAWRSAR